MNVNQVVSMDQGEAEIAFQEYRAAWMAERNRIDGELMRGYKALAEGKTLINLTEAIKTGGVNEIGLPNLAIARADEAQIEMWCDTNGSVNFSPQRWGSVRSEDRVFEFPAGTLTGAKYADGWHALLPFIPPQYRPPLKMNNYHLLWEATWQRQPRSQRRDPMLLRRISGDLFAVVAAWDLTPLEKLVLAH